MKKFSSGLTVAFLLLTFVTATWALPTTVDVSQLVPKPKHKLTTNLITEVMEKLHYKKIRLDDNLSKDIFSRYLDNLDAGRNIFSKEDIDAIKKYETKFDDLIRDSNLDPAFEIFKLFRKRLEDRILYALSTLDQKFTFDIDEEYVYDRAKEPWPENREALNTIWFKRVKNDVLSLRLAGKKNKEIKDTLQKRYERMSRNTAQLKAEDIYQIFMNSYTQSIEPHTSYFSPRTSEDFKINMSLSLEGIGAALRTDNEFTVVQKIIKGGPADMSGQLHEDDKIVGVGQGELGSFLDVVGWRLADVVDLIRGPKGSIVRLQIAAGSSSGLELPPKMVTLVRNKINLEEQAAKKTIIDIGVGKHKIRIGVIDIPTFYLDFDARARGDKDYRSTTRDVEKLVKDLNKERVDGIIIDLRGNGGGSLLEVTTLSGLFIKTGPIVQVKDTAGQIEINEDLDPEIAYEGPLAVLVDRDSASASEIFAGAIQDYGRGIIIGEPTFGKGTVQTLVDLNRFVPSPSGNLGQLKITMAQFFRITGESTQFRGVIPDIIFPTYHDDEKHGERAFENALPWARIKGVNFNSNQMRDKALVFAKEQHKERLKTNTGFHIIQKESEKFTEANKKISISLFEKKRKVERDKAEQEQKELEIQLKIALGIPLDKDKEKDKNKANKKANDDEENTEISKVLLLEAANILTDFIAKDKEIAIIQSNPKKDKSNFMIN